MKMKFFSIVLLLLLAMSFAAYGQDTPGTLKYPTSLDTPDSLFRTSDKAMSTLSSAINASATTIPVTSAATFPASGAVIIENEIIYYTGKSGNNLTGVLRGSSGTNALSHPSGTQVRGAILSAQHNTQSQAIINIQTKVGTGNSTPTNNTVLVGNGTGSSTWRALAASDISSGTFNTARLGSGTVDNTKFLRGDGSWATPSGAVNWGSIGGTLSSQTDLLAELNARVPTTRTITAGTGLTGGGDLSSNRTFSIDIQGVTATSTSSTEDLLLIYSNADSALRSIKRSDFLDGIGGGGMTIGDAVASGTGGSVLFVDSSGNLAQNNNGIKWNNTTSTLETFALKSTGGFITYRNNAMLLESGWNVFGTVAYAFDSTSVPFTVQLVASQTGEVIRAKDSSANTIFRVDANGRILIGGQTPSSASDTCTTGTLVWDSTHIYWCIATNTWIRAAGTTW